MSDESRKNDAGRTKTNDWLKQLVHVWSVVKQFVLTDESKHSAVRILAQGFAKGLLLASIPSVVGKGLGKDRVLACALSVTLVRAAGLVIPDFGKEPIHSPLTNESSKNHHNALVTAQSRTGLFSHVAQWIRNVPSSLTKSHLLGLLGAISFIQLDGKLHRSQLFAFWLFFRSVSTHVPYIPHGTVFAMCCAASLTMSAWIMAPWTLHPTYWKFLTSFSALKPDDIQYYTNSGCVRNRPCFMVHPHLTCEANIFVYFVDVFVRGLSVYGTFYAISFLFGSMRDPLSIVFNVLRSCSFAAAYGLLGWIGVCGTYRLFPGMTREKILYHSWVSGLSLFIEPEKRRGALTLYVLAFFADCLWNSFQELTAIGRRIKLPTKFMLMFASSLLFHQNQNSKPLKWLFAI